MWQVEHDRRLWKRKLGRVFREFVGFRKDESLRDGGVSNLTIPFVSVAVNLWTQDGGAVESYNGPSSRQSVAPSWSCGTHTVTVPVQVPAAPSLAVNSTV